VFHDSHGKQQQVQLDTIVWDGLQQKMGITNGITEGIVIELH